MRGEEIRLVFAKHGQFIDIWSSRDAPTHLLRPLQGSNPWVSAARCERMARIRGYVPPAARRLGADGERLCARPLSVRSLKVISVLLVQSELPILGGGSLDVLEHAPHES